MINEKAAMDETANLDWRISDALVDYEPARSFMEGRVAQIIDGEAPEMVWLL
ncbi:MAG: lipoate-protein ligase B, partial [Alphaproteobacteria bacterium]|nr:lipoate-protein ligase B [Alphaproteobacteria bacterium]